MSPAHVVVRFERKAELPAFEPAPKGAGQLVELPAHSFEAAGAGRREVALLKGLQGRLDGRLSPGWVVVDGNRGPPGSPVLEVHYTLSLSGRVYSAQGGKGGLSTEQSWYAPVIRVQAAWGDRSLEASVEPPRSLALPAQLRKGALASSAQAQQAYPVLLDATYEALGRRLAGLLGLMREG